MSSKNGKDRKLQLEAKGRIFITLGMMVLLSVLINVMMAWFDQPEELKNREAQMENRYDPQAFFLDEKGRLC